MKAVGKTGTVIMLLGSRESLWGTDRFIFAETDGIFAKQGVCTGELCTGFVIVYATGAKM